MSSFSYAFDGLELNEEEFHPLAKKYVNIETLNVRNKPENGEIVEKLARGDAVLIYDRKDDWERLSKEFESPKWVLSKYLCTFENCFLKGDLYSKSAVKNNYSRHIKSQPTTKIKKHILVVVPVVQDRIVMVQEGGDIVTLLVGIRVTANKKHLKVLFLQPYLRK